MSAPGPFVERAETRARAHALEYAGASATVEALTGDASDRRYFRVRGPSGSVVLAVHATPFDPERLPTIDATRLFRAAGLPVPDVLAVDAGRGILRLEDLGDVRLQDALTTAAPAERRAWYREAIGLLLAIQRASPLAVRGGHQAGRLAFDVEKLGFEMGFFLEHYVNGLARGVLPDRLEADLRADLDRLVRWLAKRPRVLTHRDYHARNLMVVGRTLAIIDHQDARMGPVTYDLASLVYDPYVDLDPAEVDACLEAFVAGADDAEAARRAIADELPRMALQRLLKAVGTYGYQTTVRGIDVYRPYIAPALARAHAAALRAEGFPAAARAVALLHEASST
ncbi:MAG TPA: phosphotransferase [Thermodesulfobacteriota bacterium]